MVNSSSTAGGGGDGGCTTVAADQQQQQQQQGLQQLGATLNNNTSSSTSTTSPNLNPITYRDFTVVGSSTTTPHSNVTSPSISPSVLSPSAGELNDSNLSLDELDSVVVGGNASMVMSAKYNMTATKKKTPSSIRKKRPTSNDSISSMEEVLTPQIGIFNEYGAAVVSSRRVLSIDDEESIAMSDSSIRSSGFTSNTSRSSFSSMNSSFFEELEAQFLNTSRSIHLIHLLLNPITKELFRQYCKKTRVCELFDCLEDIRLYYVTIDTFKTQSHKRKIEEMKQLIQSSNQNLVNNNNNNNRLSLSTDNFTTAAYHLSSSSSSTDSLNKKKQRERISSSGSKLLSPTNKRESVALLFNNSNLWELLQQQQKIEGGNEDSASSSFMGMFSTSSFEKDHVCEISKEERDSLKEKAQKIFNEFLSPKSNREINVDSTIRSIIETNLKNLDSDLVSFEKIYEELRILILRQLKTDVLFRFEKSSEWASFVSDTHNVSIVEQVMDYSNSIWSLKADFGGFKRMTKKECVRDYVKQEDFHFVKHVLFGTLVNTWKNITKIKSPSTSDDNNNKNNNNQFQFTTSYSKGKYFIDQDSLRLKFGCMKESASLPFSAEEVIAAIHSKLFQSITDDTLNVDESIFCLKSVPHRIVEGILPTDINKFSYNLPIPLSNKRCCYQAHSTIFEPETNRYYYFSKPIIFNENYPFEKDSVQCYSFNMICVEKIDDRNCKYSSAFISNFGGILKHFSSKVFKRIAWKRSNQTRSSLIEKLTENRDSLYNNTRDGYELCLSLLKRYQSGVNNSLDFPATFTDFQERFAKYY